MKRTPKRNTAVTDDTIGEYLTATNMIFGWPVAQSRPSMGFHPNEKQSVVPSNEPETLAVESHVITLGATGTGKGRCMLIPTHLEDGMLNHSSITLDPKGEAYRTTAAFRRRMGHQVVCLDIFGTITSEGDGLNPLDVFMFDQTSDIFDKASMMVELIRGGMSPDLRDPFWEKSSGLLLSGLIAFLKEYEEPARQNLNTLFSYFATDFDLTVAKMLDSGKLKDRPKIYAALCNYLEMSERETRPSVRATAVSNIACLASEAVEKTISRTTFDLEAFRCGDKPISIYIVIPPNKLLSHSGVLRLLLGTLMNIIATRTSAPKHKTLMLVDEAGALGNMRQIVEGVTLLRGYGLLMVLMYQDLALLQNAFPTAWRTILANCSVLQLFKVNNYLAAKELADVLGIDARRLLDLAPDEQLLVANGSDIRAAKKLDYLKDPRYRGKWDPNPMYSPAIKPNQKPQEII